jgi:Asp-tRNA(Asn)/Glu-tRNA(Gln) amidotransferase A subunit family amidase
MKNSKTLKITASVLLSFLLAKKLFSLLNEKSKKAALKSKADRKKRQITAEINQTSSLPSIPLSKSSKILSSSISELHSMLKSKETTCLEIFTAFTSTLREISSSFNCISDLDFSKGLKRAKKLDEELLSGKMRPLHGIPISIKDLIPVKGLTSSFGCMNEAFSVMSADAELVKILKKKGAVIYVKGTMSQNAASYETLNGITGRTLNPFEKTRTAGGSSGGDAVLVATRGTCAAIGTDIGGSLRYPALSCGIFTLKPTSYRVTRAGPLPLQDYPHLKNAWGPLCKNLDDLVLLMKEIVNEKPSSYIPFLPWNDQEFRSKESLNVAFCYGCEFWPVPQCFKLALDQARLALVEAGHRIKDFQVSSEIRDVTGITLAALSYDGKDFERLAGEDLIPHLRKIQDAASAGPVTRFIQEKLMRIWKGDKESIYYEFLGRKDVNDYLKNIVQLRIFKEKFLRRLDADILVFPYAVPAILHDTSDDLFPAFSYLSIFNALDWPVGHVPTGFIQNNEDYLPENDEPWAQAMRKTLQTSEGLPIGVQVAGMPFQEEKVLRVMQEIEKRIKKV